MRLQILMMCLRMTLMQYIGGFIYSMCDCLCGCFSRGVASAQGIVHPADLDPYIEVVLVLKEAHLGAARGRAAPTRRELGEVCDGSSL